MCQGPICLGRILHIWNFGSNSVRPKTILNHEDKMFQDSFWVQANSKRNSKIIGNLPRHTMYGALIHKTNHSFNFWIVISYQSTEPEPRYGTNSISWYGLPRDFEDKNKQMFIFTSSKIFEAEDLAWSYLTFVMVNFSICSLNI